MKIIKISIVVCLAVLTNIFFAQGQEIANNSDSTGLPGDHFSLQGALNLFKSSKSLEEFEKKLNNEDNAVNNLDLNGDGNIDYIRVADNKKDSAHAIVLQVPVNESEFQDVAVIEIEKTGKETAMVQIVGDEELYGENMFVEPFEEKTTVKTKSGPSNYFSMPARLIVNVWLWPSVQFIYAPAYIVWVSPWKWHHYPVWWKPWAPHPWNWHHQHCAHYNAFYYPVYKHRVVVAHQIYAPHRKTSVIVQNRYKNEHVNYKAHRGDNVNKKPVNNQKVKPNPSKTHKSVKPGNGSGRNKSNGGGGKGKRK